jgi:8-oxo-dGTP diphosphatase
MSPDPLPGQIVVGVGAVVWNELGELLLVRRANPPCEHQWSLPGGRLEFGETLRDALRREVREETGLEAEIQELVDVAELPDLAGATQYVLVDFTARAASQVPTASSDALEARWFSLDDIESVPLWSETRRVIALSAKRIRTG